MRGAPILLDTCTALWLMNGDEMAQEALAEIDRAAAAGETVTVSAITAWEVAMLFAKGRLVIAMSPEAWFQSLSDLPGVGIAPLTPTILARSCALPGSPPPDPADRMIIATARETGARIITRDRRILDFADAGHVAAIPC